MKKRGYRRLFKGLKNKNIKDMTFDELESLPKKMTGMKIISAILRYDAWDCRYYNRWNDDRSWKRFRKTGYKNVTCNL